VRVLGAEVPVLPAGHSAAVPLTYFELVKQRPSARPSICSFWRKKNFCGCICGVF
jgi:hypothetical protein